MHKLQTDGRATYMRDRRRWNALRLQVLERDRY